MRKIVIMLLAMITVGALLATGSRADNSGANAIRGDYVEARTASVFAGACHYNGELTTTGRDAIMAWNISSGNWNGTDLAGVRALAIVTSNANLSERGARRSEIIISDQATYAQTVAFVSALKMKQSQTLGEVVAVRTAPLSFVREGKSYSVAVKDVAAIDVEAMPDDLCCKMPQLVWYQPLFSLTQRKVGYTKKAAFSGDVISEPWERSGENGAFYGSFSF